uniref:Reverse transcriptase domain-containing protein n=1 Tax=Anolis carolinensis TaxID=28377 RepID=A0A803TZ64_ANOCA
MGPQNNKRNLELEQTAKQLKFIKQYNFENANKPGAWLARKIRKKSQKQQITKIKKEGKILTRDEDILMEFEVFFKALYQKNQIDPNEILQFLSNQGLQKVSESQRELLNKDISDEKIRKALKQMRPNSAPGPDGFTLIFYKTLIDEIIPYLNQIMNMVIKDKIIPESWRQVDIIVIPKSNANNTDVSNFRPISLLNTDYKIFSTILANRFKSFLNNWIGIEQKGFLPNRQMKDNVRCVLDIIEYYETFHQKEVALVTIDAEKAFDNLNWEFFKLLLNELDIGYYFINAIEAIYTKQEAKLLINGQQSNLIQIEKGTRQGCPLSPLIFIFALEILIRNIRKDGQLKGTKVRTQEYKVRAFADDIICFIEEPCNQITKWISKIENFGKVAGFFINKEKTKILTKNITKEKQCKLEELTGLKTVTKVKYLGIWITAKNAQLLKNNYQIKWREIKNDLQNWQNLNISLLGRVAVIKMNVLPKLMYLFQNLPIIRTQKLFVDWNKDIVKFVWKGKRPRINYMVMTDTTKRGGFGLPNLKLYYETCALQWVRDWTTLEDNNILTIEGFDLRRGWHAYVGYDKRKVEKNFGNHFIRAALIKIWEKYKNRFYNKTPLWISALESSQRHISQWTVWPCYKDLLVKRNRNYLFIYLFTVFIFRPSHPEGDSGRITLYTNRANIQCP